jgi:carbamoyl-phosphate synthase large subunit
MNTAVSVSPEHPVLIDKFLEDAIEVDVDAVCDGEDVYIGAVMQHVEEAGVHSGDSACVIPSISLGEGTLEQVRKQTRALAIGLGVRGLINVQFAYQSYQLYVLEVNPRGSRTVPFVSKATGVPMAQIATRVILGESLASMGLERRVPEYVSVKEAVLPFDRFPGTDTQLGPEMKSTGEVMGLDRDFGQAFAKSQEAAGNRLPRSGNVLVSVRDGMRRNIVFMMKDLAERGFRIYATEGTCKALRSSGINATIVHKIGEGKPDVVDLIKARQFELIINVPSGHKGLLDSKPIRSAAVAEGIPCITTLEGAQATVSGIDSLGAGGPSVKCIQEYCAPRRERRDTAEELRRRQKLFG